MKSACRASEMRVSGSDGSAASTAPSASFSPAVYSLMQDHPSKNHLGAYSSLTQLVVLTDAKKSREDRCERTQCAQAAIGCAAEPKLRFSLCYPQSEG